jgi:N-acetylmuramoyl-L-alanine amidase
MIDRAFCARPDAASPWVRTLRRLACCIALSVFSLCATAAVPAVSELRAVNVAAGADSADVRLDFTRPAAYKLFTLAHPDRVVVDLSGVRLAAGARLPRGVGIVQSVRAGARPHDGLRLVLEIKPGAPASARWADDPARAHAQLILSIGAAPSQAQLPLVPQPVRAVHAPVETDRPVVIAVDAGHGGQDPGAIGHNGTMEKNVVLAIARSLARRINAEDGMHAVLTRDADEFLTLRERIRRARIARADLFVSVHADSIRNREVSGSSVYVLSERGATDESARWLAERENAADLMGGVSLSDKDSTLASVLLDLSNSANISASMTAAQRVLIALDRVGEIRKPQVQQAGFVVLKSPDIPSMLIETAYISNPGEERRLRTESVQAKLADAIFSGLHSYFEQNPPRGTRFARVHSPEGVAAVLAGTGVPTTATNP